MVDPMSAASKISGLFPPWTRRRALAALGIAAGSSLAAYYWYKTWYTAQRQDEGQVSAPSTSKAPSSRKTAEVEDAAANLVHHFHSVQVISDSTTLPQMMLELEKHLNRSAAVDVLIERLRQAKVAGSEGGTNAKHALWRQLAEASFARAAAATWTVPLMDLLLRVQLNILGRHLFLESNLLEGRQPGTPGGSNGASSAPLRVSRGAQGLFLEYAHFLPERGCEAALGALREAAAAALGSLGLTQLLAPPQVLLALSAIHERFEVWAAAAGGWPALALPSPEEAAQYFASFCRAPPDNSALAAAPGAACDEDIVRGLVGEARIVLGSARFRAAMQAAARCAAAAVASAVEQELSGTQQALAKTVPRVSAVADSLLQPGSTLQAEVLDAIAALPEVTRLCASVYSCGPPLG